MMSRATSQRRGTSKDVVGLRHQSGYEIAMARTPPLCPSCGQPASEALGGPEHDWECRNEACPEFGQAVRTDEPSSDQKPGPGLRHDASP
jgi:hypothetical protein